MPAKKKTEHATVLVVLDSMLSLAIVALAGYYLKYFYTVADMENTPGKWGLVALLFLIMALSQMIRIPFARLKHSLEVVRHGIYIFVSLLCAGLILLRSRSAEGGTLAMDAYTTDLGIRVVIWIYEGALIIGRILTILRDRTPRSVFINLGLIAAIVMLMWEMELVSLIVFIAWQSLAHVGSITFSRFDMPTLRKIFHKTYAAEIMFGIVVLIIAISLVLPLVEEGITSFTDGLWYCFAIVTTIGFGDFAAVTPIGRILSVILGLYGVIVVALITSIIVNFYNEVNKKEEE